MDDDQPFGSSFGPASTRDEFLVSAQNTYYRLLKSTPGKEKLSGDIFGILAQDEAGLTDRGKKKALHKLFRPNAQNELGLLAFLQCCDSVYRRLRFFRASVGNASVIDHALESIIDGMFNFLLLLVLLSLMRFNPWPLLVSVSTLLVSISFAVSSSCSNFIEGVLLICFRRPFGKSSSRSCQCSSGLAISPAALLISLDLGDRIYMQDPSTLDANDALLMSWFIEGTSKAFFSQYHAQGLPQRSIDTQPLHCFSCCFRHQSLLHNCSVFWK